MSIQEQIKQLLVQITVDDELPMDMYALDESLFNPIIQPLIEILECLRKDAEMALDGSWDCTTQEGIETGFTAQIKIIDEILNQQT